VSEQVAQIQDKPRTVGGMVVKFTKFSVLFQALGTIFGAAMFLLFGIAVGNVGLAQVVIIIVLGHLVTGAVAFTTSELASNKRIGSGGEYAMVKTTHGIHIGGAIGMTLTAAQTISITFYGMAVAIGLTPVVNWVFGMLSLGPVDMRHIATAVILAVFILNLKGGDVTVRFLVPILLIIGVAVASFVIGVFSKYGGTLPLDQIQWNVHIPEGMTFWAAFAIMFPAFTGNTMGIGLSGELKNPETEIPWGTKIATLISIIVYLALAVLLSLAATPEQLATDELVMSRVSVWPPLISIGLVVASLSSLIGSMVVAPRTLQAISADRVLPLPFLKTLWGKKREPYPALIVCLAISLMLVYAGDLQYIALFVTMFFLLTYMADCSASFLENVSQNPSYRPAQRAPWWISMVGMVMAFIAAINIRQEFFFLSLAILAVSVLYTRWRIPEPRTQSIFGSLLFRIERMASLRLRSMRLARKNWQPTVLAIGTDPMRKRPFTQFLEWIGARYGLVTLCQMVPLHGTFEEGLRERQRAYRALSKFIRAWKSHMIPDAILTNRLSSSILDRVQSGSYHTNTVAFAVEQPDEPEMVALKDIYRQLLAVRKNILILRSWQQRFFGARRRIHIWWSQPENGHLMVILSYILLTQRDWRNGTVTINYIAEDEEAEQKERYLKHLIEHSRFMIGGLTYRRHEYDEVTGITGIISERSADADLVFLGLPESLDDVPSYVERWNDLSADVVFVHSNGDANLAY
jgi:amino acid transporter